MKFFKKAFNKCAFLLYRSIAKRKLSRLAEKNLSAKLLKTALQQTLDNSLQSDEKDMIKKIESLRKTLNSSQQIIIDDLAANSKTQNQSETGQTVANICRIASKSYFWCLFLFKLIRTFQPGSCLELGTCLGISASYQASALKLNSKGRLHTLEGSRPRALLAQENFKKLQLDNVKVVVGKFDDTLENVLHEIKPIDYAFIDGHHDQHATIRYFNQLYPHLSDNSVIVFDDISWSKGMKKAWQTIRSDRRIEFYIDLFFVGICVIKKQ